ncbi:UDP-N-acetyl-D-mannosamine dehydrogenase [Kangiella sediminilitoris]|uniref:Nucleotide sugar dehydrogenase n=1 Tax=Kangiella sediminilitoris TaxID=1144748 RepID=A0A1B3BBK0_9GAMM|nr:UDP-N-acetyl-D-mannosamine dehydrogenase [Kangiella sediminilitoris]AOE50166.1 Nucleotide sugar dehydrogenase [Kangiella sediminilitoris]
MSFDTVSVVGLGYIGLPTAAMFASRKKKVIGVDVNQDAIDTINRGEIHIVEPDLDTIVHATVTEGFLQATTKPEPADAFLIAVPTPFKEDHEPDLSYIEASCKAIAPVLEKGNLVILESTSPVGATEAVAKWLAREREDLSFPHKHNDEPDVNVAHCPERVLPGHVVRELVENDRVIGGITPECSRKAVELYSCFVQGECIITNARTAEMAKLTENSFRDVNIAFANELSIICDKLDIDVWELIKLSNRHPRVNILQPGPGVGGHCIAVDPWFIISKTPKEAKLIRVARDVNDEKPSWVLQKVKESIADFLLTNPEKTAKDISIACYGITFKPDIDDLRESPALAITKQVLDLNQGDTLVVEPNVIELPEELSKAKIIDLNESLISSDIHLMLVDHKEFKLVEGPSSNLIDTKGIWG